MTDTSRTALFEHSACLLHDMGPTHPECPARLKTAKEKLLESPLYSQLIHFEAQAANQSQLKLAHDSNYVENIFAVSPETGQLILDADTSMNPHTLDAALMATGAVCLAIDKVVQSEIDRAFCLTRPPGHHAEADRAMGFCLFNSVAVGTLYALKQTGIHRVAVLDFDVHHGNGTENILSNKEGVLFCSTFQSPFYPFSGTEPAASNVINTPLSASSTPADFRAAVSDHWLPALEAFKPDLILISAGFDAHVLDGISNLELTEDDYAWVTAEIRKFADEHCQGRVISTLEGGYHLQALANSVQVHIEELARD